jgi:two-component system, OmpR family, phosphate regulon sensor histidine kinase PhoR
MKSSQQRQSLAAAFSIAALGFAFANLLAEPNAINWLYTGLAAFVAFLILKIRPPVDMADVTNGKVIRDQMTAPDAFSQADFDALPLPVLIVDPKTLIVSANKSASTEFGRFDSGAPLLLRFRSPEIRQAFQRATDQHVPVHFEMHERVPIERWMRVDICPIPGQTGDIDKSLILFRDISESRKLDRMRADFVANASHELRTPLASISGFIDTLRGPAKEDVTARDRFLAIMQEQANRMSRLIDDLLSLSRLEMRSMTDDAVALDLVSVINEALDSMQPVASESGVDIERRFSGGPYLIRGLRDELIQVIENLVENACKYGKSGKKVILEIDRRKIDDGSEITLSVRDFGPGIDPEHLPRLTERFYRASASGESTQKGTGLGLAIVKHIVTRHRGRLSISSQPGKGSTFAISLPEMVESAQNASN